MSIILLIKKISLFVLMSVLLLIFSASHGSAQDQNVEQRIFNASSIQQSSRLSLTLEELAWLKAHPVINIGIDSAYAPFEFIDVNGKYRGIAPDYLDLISDRLSIKFEVVPGLKWKQVLEGAKDGTVDMVPVITNTDERRGFLNFTQPYLSFPFVIIDSRGLF